MLLSQDPVVEPLNYEETYCSRNSPTETYFEEFSQDGTEEDTHAIVEDDLQSSTDESPSACMSLATKSTRNVFPIRHCTSPTSPDPTDLSESDEYEAQDAYEVAVSSPIMTRSRSEKSKLQDFSILINDEGKTFDTSKESVILPNSTTEHLDHHFGLSSRKEKPVQVVCLVEDTTNFPEHCKVEIADGKVSILILSSDYRCPEDLVTTIRGILTYKKVLKKLTERSKSNPNFCHVFITFKTSNCSKTLFCRDGAIFVKQRKLKNQLRLTSQWTKRSRVQVEPQFSESDDESDTDISSTCEVEGGSEEELAPPLSPTPIEPRISQDDHNSRKLRGNEGRMQLQTFNKEETELEGKRNKRKSFSEPEPSEDSLEARDSDDESWHESESKRVRFSSEIRNGPGVKEISCVCGTLFNENV